MTREQIAQLAASVAAGSITYAAASAMLSSDGELSTLDSLIAAGAGAAGGELGAIAAKAVMRTPVVRQIRREAADALGFFNPFSW